MIQGVKEYIAACPLLVEIPVKARHVDWTSGDADNYGIMFDSDNLVKSFISGGGKHEYNFTLFVRKFAKEDVDRLANTEFIERLQDWCCKQNAAKNFPARKGKYAVEVSSCDDDDDMIIKGNFNGQGDEVMGWFDPADGKWTETDPAAQTANKAEENE